MKTLVRFASLLTLATALLAPSAAFATAPSILEPSYDAATRTLTVKIRHWSLADGLHYVKYVEIAVNGAAPAVTKYDRQPGNEYTYTYTVEAAPGDVIDVTAKCSLWGSRKASIKVGAVAEQPAAPAAQPPANQ